MSIAGKYSCQFKPMDPNTSGFEL